MPGLRLVPRGPRLLLGPADRCDLRPAEGDPWHEVHSHRLGVVAGQLLDGDDGLVAGDVREGEAGDDVADRVQVRCAGPHELVDLDVAAIDSTPSIASRPMFSVSGRRPTATRMTSTARSVRFDPSLLAIWKVTLVLALLQRLGVDRRRDVRGDAPLAEDPRQLLADLRILERHDPIRELDEGHLRAEVAVHRRPLDADRAGADDRDSPRHVAAASGPRRS